MSNKQMSTFTVDEVTYEINDAVARQKNSELEEDLDKIDKTLDELSEPLKAVANMTAVAESLPAGSAPTAEYENGVLTLGIPQGASVAGKDGVGIVSIKVLEVS